MIANQKNEKIKKGLIAYCSKYGCTEEIALKIKETLDKSSVNTEIVKMNDKNQFESLINGDLGRFSNILIGSNIIAGKFHKNINKLIDKLESASLNEIKLGFFICCMKACNHEKIIEAKNQYLEPKLKEHNLKISIVDAFGGKLDFSSTSPLNFLIKGIVKKIMSKDNPELKKIEPKIYDFRNWQQIEKFTTSWLNIIRNG